MISKAPYILMRIKAKLEVLILSEPNDITANSAYRDCLELETLLTNPRKEN